MGSNYKSLIIFPCIPELFSDVCSCFIRRFRYYRHFVDILNIQWRNYRSTLRFFHYGFPDIRRIFQHHHPFYYDMLHLFQSLLRFPDLIHGFDLSLGFCYPNCPPCALHDSCFFPRLFCIDLTLLLLLRQKYLPHPSDQWFEYYIPNYHTYYYQQNRLVCIHYLSPLCRDVYRIKRIRGLIRSIDLWHAVGRVYLRLSEAPFVFLLSLSDHNFPQVHDKA